MTQEERNELIWFAKGMELAFDMIQKDLFTVASEILSLLAETCKGNSPAERKRIAWSITHDFTTTVADLWARSDKGVRNDEKPVS